MTQVHRVKTSSPYYSLSFDDGPDSRLTPILLDFLRSYQARATFFVIGERAIRHPSLIRRIVDEGHEVGNHSYSHPYMLKLSDWELLTQVDRAQYAIFDACGCWPSLFRAPHGRIKESQLAMLHFNRKIRCCYWSIDTKDWRDLDASSVETRLFENTRQGEIVLAHDTLDCGVQGVQDALRAISGTGLSSIPISELLEQGEVISKPRGESVDGRLNG